jgi:hypothetical protein
MQPQTWPVPIDARHSCIPRPPITQSVKSTANDPGPCVLDEGASIEAGDSTSTRRAGKRLTQWRQRAILGGSVCSSSTRLM